MQFNECTIIRLACLVKKHSSRGNLSEDSAELQFIENGMRKGHRPLTALTQVLLFFKAIPGELADACATLSLQS